MLFTVNIHGPICDTSSDPAATLETAVARAFPGFAVTVNLELPEPEGIDPLLRTVTIVLDVGAGEEDDADLEGAVA
jgi:hypothetical protein